MPIAPTQTLAAALDIIAGAPFAPETLHAPPTANERVIEVPWAAAMLKDRKAILDIGFTFADADYLGVLLALRRAGAAIEGVDIVDPARVAQRYPEAWRAEVLGVPVRLGDVRTMALPAGAYDAASLISTIEHVGFDAPSPEDSESAFARPRDKSAAALARDPNADKAVMARLAGALAPGARAVISVPMGEGGARATQDSMGRWATYWEYAPADLASLCAAPGYRLTEQRFFARAAAGWRETSESDAATYTADETGLPEACALLCLERLAA